MSNPNITHTPLSSCKPPKEAENSQLHKGQIDEQMRLLVRQLGGLVGHALAITDRTEHRQNDILKNRDPE